MSFCLYVRLFVRLSETCVAAGARAAVDGRQRPHRCCTAHTTGVPDVSSVVKNFNPAVNLEVDYKDEVMHI